MTSRRAFIAAGAALAASSDGFAIAAADEADPERTVAPFDLGALMARLNEPAKHKQVFATAHVTDGVVLAYINNSMNAYEKGFGEGPGALRPAAVFYGHGVVLALDDYAWKTYKIADAMKRAGEAVNVQARDVNPYWHAPDGQNSLDDLAARGVIFMACNNALHGVARLLAQGGGNGDDTYADLRKHLIPGVILVPAGVAAINAAQEARFTFFQAAI